jgi:hypothetical protein
MSDTIDVMDYVKVDILTAGQLEVDDLILVGDEVVSIVEIISLRDGYTIETINDFLAAVGMNHPRDVPDDLDAFLEEDNED